MQEYSHYVGLGQASLISLYCTYLVLSAVIMEPDDSHCNPLSQKKNTELISNILGAFFAFLTIAFTTARTASIDLFCPTSAGVAVQEDNHISGNASYRVESENLVHKNAMHVILKDNKISENVLNIAASPNRSTNNWIEEGSTRTILQLLFFHLIYILSICWTATWLAVQTDDKYNSLKSIGRTYWASWIKILSSELCYSLYIWSLIAPIDID